MAAIQGSISVEFGGEHLHLLPDRAVWWPARGTLIVADVHLGKGTAFRSAGLPIPSGNSAKDLRRLDLLLKATAASRLVVLGDLIHARGSHQQELLEAICHWRQRHAEVRMLLIRGNHDRRAGALPAAWQIEEVEEPFDEPPFTLSHIPRFDQSKHVLSGHIHPASALRDFDGSSVRMPCFVFDDVRRCAVLPAFGSFTGGRCEGWKEGERIFLTSGKSVIRV